MLYGYLFIKGIDINFRSRQGEEKGTALLYALDNQHDEVAKLLLSRPEIDINAKGLGFGPALLIAARTNNLNLFELIIKNPNLVIDTTTNGFIEIWLAENKNQKMTELYLAKCKQDIKEKNSSCVLS